MRTAYSSSTRSLVRTTFRRALLLLLLLVLEEYEVRKEVDTRTSSILNFTDNSNEI